MTSGASNLLIIKYLWPVGVVFGLIVLGIQIYSYASTYDPAIHGLGEDPSLISLSWDIISGKYHTRLGRGIPVSAFIVICVVAGIIVNRIDRPKRTGIGY